MDIRERYRDQQEELLLTQDAHQSRIWTMLPGVIIAYTVKDGSPVASVKLAIKGYDSADDGSKVFHDLPDLPHCPVIFPRGGGYSLTFPVKAGDECMVLFSCRSIDEWWQSGMGQPPYDFRQHDLSDGICYVGLTSQARPLQKINTSTVQLRSDDQKLLLELDKEANAINITAPTVNIKGEVKITGNVEVMGGVMASDDVVGVGISLSKHTHGGVQSGKSSTEKPQ